MRPSWPGSKWSWTFIVLASLAQLPEFFTDTLPDAFTVFLNDDCTNFYYSTTWYKAGTTLNGSPYWQSSGWLEAGYYFNLYYDADWSGTGSKPAWLLVNARLNTSKLTTMAEPSKTVWYPRFETEDASSPPVAGLWKVRECYSNSYTPPDMTVMITFFDISATPSYHRLIGNTGNTGNSVSDTGNGIFLEPVHGESGVVTSTTTKAPSPDFLVLRGDLCYTLSGITDGRLRINYPHRGITWQYMGDTANGSPYFKAFGTDLWIYYDDDCSGTGEQAAMWMLTWRKPSLTALKNLVGDGTEMNLAVRHVSPRGATSTCTATPATARCCLPLPTGGCGAQMTPIPGCKRRSIGRLPKIPLR